ncbi:MAG: DUF92 domain-containing protein [Sphaerochaetaceae bacterium]
MSQYANLVPPCLSFVSLFNTWFFALPYPQWILLALMLTIGILAYVAKQLTFLGALCAVIIGFGITWILGFGALLTMLLFFLAAGVLGKIAKAYRARTQSIIQKKGGCRDSAQVLANGSLALVCALCYAYSPSMPFLVMFACSVSEAASDTASGDVGILSKQTPVSLVSGRPMPRGLSGAVTSLGMLSGFIASFVIALCWFSNFFAPSAPGFLLMAIVTISGFLGSVFDSFLGCTVQACYYDHIHDRLTEHSEEKGIKFELRRGLPWMDNDMVNFLSNLFACLIGGMLSVIL